MKCSKCGAELPPSLGKFCPKCGADLGKNDQPPVKKEPAAPRNHVGVIILAAAMGFALISISIAILLIWNGRKSTDDAETVGTHRAEENTPASGSNGESILSDDNTPEYLKGLVKYETAEYNYSGLPILDLSLRNHAPNPKQEGMEWDSSLFYTLEDIYEDSTEDNQIAHYTMSVHIFINKQSENMVQCFVYAHPDNGQINKIVTVEQQNENYLVSDYYYDNGKINFVFTRTVDVYTPTYATIDKVGTRYYFNNDVMVRYRTINMPRAIVQQTLNPAVTWYPNTSYFALGGEERAAYDAVEYQVLNEAYNIYDAVRNPENIYALEGHVYSAEGSPLADVSVSVIDADGKSVLYSGETAEDGSYHIYVSLDHTDCYLQVYSEGYLPVYVHDIRLDQSIWGNAASCIYLSKIEAQQEDVALYLYNSLELTGNADAAPLRNAQVVIRRGLNARSGEGVATGNTGETGVYETTLAPGAYTAQYSLEGFASTYENFYVTAGPGIVKGYTVSAITDATEKILLCWDSDIDLDLLLYTPEKSAYGDMNYVSITQPSDNYGNFLAADGTVSRCEVLNISNTLQGLYKIYVNDYTNYQNGVYDSTALATSGARIYVYTSEGLVAVYRIDSSKSGLVWNVCEKGTSYYPCSIVSSYLDNYAPIDKNRITANVALEMYRQFLLGNVTADYQGEQITYDTLLWGVFYGYDNWAKDLHQEELFALTDINMDNVPELQIYYWGWYDAGVGAIYTIDLTNGNLKISERDKAQSLSMYKNGAIGAWYDSGPVGGVIISDGAGNDLANFVHLYDYDYVEPKSTSQRIQEIYDSAYNGAIPYVYVTSDDETFDAYVERFISEYCGGKVTFHPVDESSIWDNLKWEK